MGQLSSERSSNTSNLTITRGSRSSSVSTVTPQIGRVPSNVLSTGPNPSTCGTGPDLFRVPTWLDEVHELMIRVASENGESSPRSLTRMKNEAEGQEESVLALDNTGTLQV